MVHRNYHEVDGASPSELGGELGRLFGPIMREYVGEERDGGRQRKRDAEVLLSRTAKYFPAYIQELEAYADAARIPLLDLWMVSIGDELDDEVCERCTTVVTNRGRLIAHNEDWDDEAEDDICLLKKTCGSSTVLELYYYGCPLGGTAFSICSNGYIQAVNSIDHSDWQIGVPKTVLARRLSELRDAGRELGSLLAIPRCSGFAHNLIDRTGRVTAIECTAKRHVVHHPEMPFVHTNHLLQPSLARFENAHDKKSTLRRYDRAVDLISASMDRGGLTRLMDDRTAGRTTSVCNDNTIARVVVDLDRRVARFWLKRESQKGWVDYPIDFLFDASSRSA